jgi:hypothetical protein
MCGASVAELARPVLRVASRAFRSVLFATNDEEAGTLVGKHAKEAIGAKGGEDATLDGPVGLTVSDELAGGRGFSTSASIA